MKIKVTAQTFTSQEMFLLRPRMNAMTWRIFGIVCQVLWAKVVGAISSEGFLAYFEVTPAWTGSPKRGFRDKCRKFYNPCSRYANKHQGNRG